MSKHATFPSEEKALLQYFLYGLFLMARLSLTVGNIEPQHVNYDRYLGG